MSLDLVLNHRIPDGRGVPRNDAGVEPRSVGQISPPESQSDIATQAPPEHAGEAVLEWCDAIQRVDEGDDEVLDEVEHRGRHRSMIEDPSRVRRITRRG